MLSMKNKMGTLSVTSKITGYKHSYFALENIQFEVSIMLSQLMWIVAIYVVSSASVR